MFCILGVFSCKKDSSDEPTTGSIKGKIIDSETTTSISGVLVSVYDPNTNTALGITTTSSSDGNYSLTLDPGSYSLRLFRQGYESVPPAGVSPVVLTVDVGKTIVNDFEMDKSTIVNAGYISGKVTYNNNGVANVLVVADDGSKGYSSTTDQSGNFVIYNIPVGTYTVRCWKSGYSSDYATPVVTANTQTSNVNLTLTEDAGYTVSGQISFLATGSVEIDVALVHPITKEPIPGLTTKTVGGEYSFSNVPNGTYIGRASYENDTKVLDPDWIVKNGEPTVIVNAASVQLDFSVTGAVTLTSPTNALTTTEPVVVTTLTPTFTWVAYSSVSDYVIEVSDVSGHVIWGGFSNNWNTKNIVIPKTQLSITYNSDGNATASLESGKIYRWRIYVSKDDNSETNGWKLISVSEEQQGLFKVEI